MERDVIIACDFKDEVELMNFLSKFDEEKPFLKIGMELFYGCGPSVVRKIKELGFKIFLDLKLHDIPNTVKKAMRNLAALNVDMVNVHCAGTVKMMQAALEGLQEGCNGGKRPICIGVTQLTSTDSTQLKEELLIEKSMEETVKKYALNAKEAGLDGVVCSALEAGIIKELGMISVTPGIRFADNSVDDQKRVVTPAKAKELGSTYIVVGRAITGASDPKEAYKRCVKEFM